MSKCAFVIAFLAPTLSACILLDPISTPESVPIQIDKSGPLGPIDLTLLTCTYVEATIYFPKSELISDQLKQLAGGARNGSKQVQGAPVRMKVDVRRLSEDDSGRRDVDWRSIEKVTDIIESWSDAEWGRIIGGLSLPAGHYRIQATLVEAQTQLVRLHPRFEISSNLKTTPAKGECSVRR